MKVQKILLPIIIAVGVLAFLSMFIVKETNQAIVLQFGDPKRIITKPGLNFKIPFIQKRCFSRYKNFKFRYTTRRSYCIGSKTFNC
jgi:membrane protease subunit HflC